MKTIFMLFLLLNIASCSSIISTNRANFDESKREDFCRGVKAGYKEVRGPSAIYPYCPRKLYTGTSDKLLNLNVYRGIEAGMAIGKYRK